MNNELQALLALLSLLAAVVKNGNVHKILAQDGDPFVVAEYEPFTTRTHISSMLLDNENKTLYVSSGAEVIQIRLQNCSVYGNRCDSCVMARDPYCGWDWTTCSNTTRESIIQDVTHGNYSICNGHHTCEIPTNSMRDSPNIVPQDSKYFLTCPMESQHASYVWVHQNRRRECVSAEQDCLLLIDSMSEKDEGVYNCVASENGCNRTIVHQKLQMNAASQTRTTHAALACLLFVIYVIC